MAKPAIDTRTVTAQTHSRAAGRDLHEQVVHVETINLTINLPAGSADTLRALLELGLLELGGEIVVHGERCLK